MREWLTNRELAEAVLPGLPKTRARVKEFARRHRWKSRAVPGAGLRGGPRIEWHVSNLTEEHRIALIEREQKQNLTLPVAAVQTGASAVAAVEGVAPESPTGAKPAVAAGTIIIPATQADIDRAVAQHEAASPLRQKKGAVYAKALKELELDIERGLPIIAACRAAACRAGISLSRIRELRDVVQGFDETLWPAVVTPSRLRKKVD